MSLLDQLATIQPIELRDSIRARFEDPSPPSDCAPVPVALTKMYDCVGTETAQLQKGYEPFAQQSGAAATDEKCGRTREEYQEAYKILAGLKQRADHISQYSEDTLSTCIKRWTTWLEVISKAKKDQTDPKKDARVSAMVAKIIDRLKENLDRVVNTETSAQQTIGSINDALDITEASVIGSLLGCN